MNTHSNPKIQKLLDQIDNAYTNGEIEEFNAKNEKLRDYAQESGDELAHLIYRYNDLNNDFDETHFDICEKGNKELIGLFMAHNAYYYVLRCYNTLGIIESERAHYYECLGHYIDALQIAEKHSEYCFSSVLSNNIGNVFVWLNEYEHALPYLLKAYELYDAEKLDIPRDKAVVLINIIECYGCLKRYKESYEWYQVPFEYTENEICVKENLLLCNNIEQATMNKEVDTLYLLYDKVLDNVSKYDEYIYHFRTLLRTLSVCIELNDRAYCKQIMNVMDTMNKASAISSFTYDYAELKMKYYFTYRDLNDEDFTKYSDEFYHQSSLAFTKLRSTYAQSMVLRLDLEKVKDERQSMLNKNVILEKNLELDPFTKIYNKNGIKKNCIEQMTNSKKQANHALLVMDIDKFKNVNDTYGHKAGDDVLLQVVKLLKSFENDHLLVGRFGGDEFILFYVDFMDMKEVEELAGSLIRQANKILIPTSEHKSITFSIGIHSVQGNVDFEHMFFKADKALYNCKNEGRNGYRIYKE